MSDDDSVSTADQQAPKKKPRGFQKGHAWYPSKQAPGHGRRASVQRMAGAFAGIIGEEIPLRALARGLWLVVTGVKPRIVPDPTSDDGWRAEPDPGQPAPTIADQLAAAKVLLERGMGSPMQNVSIQAELTALTADVGTVAGSLGPAGVLGVLRALREAREGSGRGGASGAPALAPGPDVEAEDAEIVSSDSSPSSDEPAPASEDDLSDADD